MIERNNQDSIIETLIRGYIGDIIHLSLATSINNIPWITEVHFSYDRNMDFYFLSRPSRRHSQESRQNQNVAGNIIRQHHIGEKVTGVYFEGIIEELDKVKENDTAYITYHERFGIDPSVLEEQAEENGHRFYKIQVKRFALYDEVKLVPPGKYELEWNK